MNLKGFLDILLHGPMWRERDPVGPKHPNCETCKMYREEFEALLARAEVHFKEVHNSEPS